MKRKGSTEDIFEDDRAFPVTCVESEEGPRIYNIYIFNAIENTEQFIPALGALQVAGEDDYVMVHISTPGGDVDATDTFLQALSFCKAPVVFFASGGVHSAGTLILMHAKDVIISEGFNALIHNGSIGHGGKFSDWRAATEYYSAHMESLFRKAYKGFLTEEEISQLVQGKDFWFDAKEFEKRLKNRKIAHE